MKITYEQNDDSHFIVVEQTVNAELKDYRIEFKIFANACSKASAKASVQNAVGELQKSAEKIRASMMDL